MPVACRTLPQLACSPISMGFQEKGGDKSDLLDQLYPIPLSESTGVVSLPGPTEASARALLNVLLHNRENYHIFFNDKEYHKYVGFSHDSSLASVSDILL